MRDRQAPGFVYFIASLDRSMVKIGWSSDPNRRFIHIRSGSPLDLELLGFAPGTIDDERAVHARFLPHHSHCEWFFGHPEILALADAIAAGGEIPADLRGFFPQREPLGNHSQGRKRTPDQCERIAAGAAQARVREKSKWEAARRGIHPGIT